LTGGEPCMHADLPLFICQLKERGWRVKLDTNGSNPEMLETLIDQQAVDFVAMDVKAPLDLFSYCRSSGLPIDLTRISKSIEILKQGKVEYQFRMTVVPQLHSEEAIQTLGQQLKAGPRLVLQNFNPENPLDPSLKEVAPYDPKRLKEMEKKVQSLV